MAGAQVGLAAFPGARALLIGTGRHALGSALPDVPAVADTLADLKSALVTCCGMADDAVRVVADPATAQVLGEAVAEAADQAQGMLLVYYVGHGLVSQDGGLHLAACQTEGFRADRRVSRVEVTALPYAHLRNLVLESEARSRVVVLDCCFSGRALAGLANPGDEVANSAQVAGGFVLTSAGGEEVAFAPAGARHTAFTGALLKLLHAGDPHAPQWLTLQQVYRYLTVALPAAGFPRPRQRADGRIGELVLAPNPAYRPPQQWDTRPKTPTVDAALVGACPYKGLAAFDEADQAWFRGRQALVARVVARLTDRLDDPRPLVVTGASGSGKSSLLRAGLLPALGRGELGVVGSSSWRRLVFTPTADPVGCLAEHLAPLLSAAQLPAAVDDRGSDRVVALVRRNPAQLAILLRQALPDAGLVGPRLVLVIDQFEEVFALCEDEVDRQAFIHALAAFACDADGAAAALVVLGVRADFYGRCTIYPELASALEGQQIVVAAMTAAQIREAIEEPAQAVGLGVESGLVELLLADLGAHRDSADGTDNEVAGAYEPGRLPLLAHALRESWHHRTADTLTVAAYRRSGGIHGALAATADRVLSGFDEDGQEMARRLLLRLIRIGEGSDDTRRREPRADLLADTGDPTLASVVLDAFAAARLVTADDAAVEITHEALLRAWPAFRTWIDNDRAGLLVQQQLIDAAQEWLRHERDSSTLYTGSRLALARQWAGPQRRTSLPTAAVEFLTTSTAHEQQRQQQELAEQAATRRRARRNLAVAAVLAVLLAGSLTGGGLAVAQWQRANTQQLRAHAEQQRAIAQQRAATGRGLTLQAESLRASDPTTAIRLGLAAIAISSEPQTRASLEVTLAGGRPVGIATLTDHTGGVWDVALSPDGRTLVTAGVDDKTATLWDFSNRSRPMIIATLTSPGVSEVAFSPDGRTLITTASGDVGTRSFWDVSDRSKPQRIANLPGPLLDGGFSPDGRTLAASDGDGGAVRLWDLSNRSKPQRIATLTGHAAIVYAVAFSPDGRTLATASMDGTARLWDVSDRSKPQHTATLTGHTDQVFHVLFNPDGRTLATVSSDGTTRLWDVSDRTKPQHVGTVHDLGVAFSPDGHVLVTVGDDQIARLWDVSDRSRPQRISVLVGTNPAVAFSPDGRTLVTAGDDLTVQLWDIIPMAAIKADPVGEACRVASGGSTLEEWNRYVSGLPYTRACPG